MSHQEVVPVNPLAEVLQRERSPVVEITTTLKGPGKLADALDKARARCKAAHKDSTNTFHKYKYASAESILDEAKAALEGTGVALIPVRNELQVKGSGPNALLNCHRWMLLTHASGEAVPVEFDWPVIPDRGRPTDKAYASALTTGLAYYLRDLLAMPRVDPEDDIAGREDRDEPAATPPPKPPPAAPKPAPPAKANGNGTHTPQQTFANRLKVTEDGMVKEGLCQPGELLKHIAGKGIMDGFPADIGQWDARQMGLGGEWARQFREQKRNDRARGNTPGRDLDDEADAAMARDIEPFDGE